MASQRPNVLWIMSDQHNARACGYAGNSDVKTPNLDRLAGEGISFTNAYCNNPICAPSRMSFITGQYVHTHGFYGNDNRCHDKSNPNALAGVFRRDGYQTALIGKSHTVTLWDRENYEHIRYNGFCDADPHDPLSCHYFKYLLDRGLEDLYVEGTENKAGFPEAFNGSKPWRLDYEHSVEHYTGEETLEFLKHRDESRPFFVSTSFLRPHDPYTPAPEFFDMYDPDDISLPRNICDAIDGFPTKPAHMQERARGTLVSGDQSTNRFAYAQNEAVLRRAVASYYGLVSANDHEIGRIISYLKETGDYENTIIVYTADHGDFAGEHGLMAKCFGLFDAIHNIPFLIRFPGCPQGVTSESFIESIDLLPTLCELAGVRAPESIDGTTFIQGAQVCSQKDAAYCEGSGISAIRTRDYRLVFHGGSDDHELYDYTKDPDELNNVYDATEYADIRRDLCERLLAFTLQSSQRSNSDTAVQREAAATGITTLIHQKGKYYSEVATRT